MKNLMFLMFISAVGYSCGTSQEMQFSSSEIINSSVSPRAEKQYVQNNKGLAGFNGSNPEARYDRDLAEYRKNKKIESDTLSKEFATNGYSVNTKFFDCEIYETDPEGNQEMIEVRGTKR